MGTGKRLTELEKGKILAYKSEGLSNRSIGKKIHRSNTVINNFFNKKEKYGCVKISGRPKTYTPRDERRILKMSSNSTNTAGTISSYFGPEIKQHTVLRIINKSKNLKRLKMKRCPKLSADDKKLRLEFCKTHMSWIEDWKRVVFSDEKRFNLDGPNSYGFYFHDLRKEEVKTSNVWWIYNGLGCCLLAW